MAAKTYLETSQRLTQTLPISFRPEHIGPLSKRIQHVHPLNFEILLQPSAPSRVAISLAFPKLEERSKLMNQGWSHSLKGMLLTLRKEVHPTYLSRTLEEDAGDIIIDYHAV